MTWLAEAAKRTINHHRGIAPSPPQMVSPVEQLAPFKNRLELEAATNALRRFQPVFVAGPYGSGKTTLAEACVTALDILPDERLFFIFPCEYTPRGLAAQVNAFCDDIREKKPKAVVVDEVTRGDFSEVAQIIRTIQEVGVENAVFILVGTDYNPSQVERIRNMLEIWMWQSKCEDISQYVNSSKIIVLAEQLRIGMQVCPSRDPYLMAVRNKGTLDKLLE